MAATSIYLAETGIVQYGKSQYRSLKVRDKLHAPLKKCRLLIIIVVLPDTWPDNPVRMGYCTCSSSCILPGTIQKWKRQTTWFHRRLNHRHTEKRLIDF